jgi:hypothetical protein
MIATYMIAIRMVAIRKPPNPPASKPKFQLKYSPEMTYPIPRKQISQTPAYLVRARSSRYSLPTCSYSTAPTRSRSCSSAVVRLLESM